MRIFLGMVLFAVFASQVHAGGFYKWRDSSGVLHITDHPPESSDEVEVDAGSRVNKAPMGNLDFGSMGQPRNQEQATGVDKALQDTIKGLESEIAYLESQKRMDPSMERDGLRSDIRQKQEMLRDLYLERSGVSKEEIALMRMQEKEERRQKAKARARKPQHVLAGPQGQVYVPGAGGNYIHTGTGALMLPQGGNTLLNTQTGKIVIGN